MAKWRAQLEMVDDVEHATIDLAARRGLDRHVDVPELGDYATEPATPPAPAGHDHESYGATLDVPSFDPRAGAGHAHLWYVVEDVEVLAQLLSLGVERWGQLDTLLETTELAVVEGRAAIEDATRCGAALEEFVRSWQQGRGKRVDRATIERADGVTDNFVDEVSELAKDCNGDAEEILTALRNGEVARYRRNKADELEEFFEANGYIDPSEPLTPEQIRVRVIDQLVAAGLDRDTARARGARLLDRIATETDARAAADD